jgi:hypothetical protein
MSCKKYSIVNNESYNVYFNYRKCDDNIFENQVLIEPGQTKNIWLLDNSFSCAFLDALSIDDQGYFPFTGVTQTPSVTPTQAYSSTPTPTQTVTPTKTPTNTPTTTTTPTITPSITPSPTDIVESCSEILFGYVGPNAPLFEFMDCSGNTIQMHGVPSWSANYCGNYDSAIILSGDGVINYIGTCTDPSLYNPTIVPLGYSFTDPNEACTDITTDYYYQTGGESLTVGDHIYSDYSADPAFYVTDGYYSDGTNVYVITGGTGYIDSIIPCSVTPTPTPTPTPTVTVTETPTNTPTETSTNTPTVTETPTNTPTETSTNTPTVTETPTNTPSETPTNTPTETETPTPTETPTNTPTPSTTPIPVTGYSFNLIQEPYSFPITGNTIMNDTPPSQTGTTNPNELTLSSRGIYFNTIDSDGVDRTDYFSAFTGQSITITLSQTGSTAIYSGDTNAFKYWTGNTGSAPFVLGDGFVFGTGVGTQTIPPSGSAVLIQSASTNWVSGQTVYISAVIN